MSGLGLSSEPKREGPGVVVGGPEESVGGLTGRRGSR